MKTQTKNKQIQRLTKTVMTAYSIHADNPLNIIGRGTEASNYEAVENWIMSILANPNEKLAESILPILIDQFDEVIAGGK